MRPRLPRRGRQRRRRGDDGMTMAELSVSLVVFGMLLAATLLLTMQVQGMVVRDSASEDCLQATRYAMDVAGKDLHSATKNKIGSSYLAFSETTGTAVTFYVPKTIGSTTGLVQERLYRDSSGVLWRRTTEWDPSSVDPTYTYTTNRNQRTEQLASQVSADTSGTPILGYVIDGAVSTSVTTDTDRARIESVVITLTVSPRSGSGAGPVTLTSTVSPLNG